MQVWKIGMLQGRILPDDVRILQFFPSKWQEEMQRFKESGFDFVELLADKALSDHNPLYHDPLWPGFKELTAGLDIPTPIVCADFFTQYPFTGSAGAVSRSLLLDLMQKVDECRGAGIVVPFLGKAEVSSGSELEAILSGLGEALKFTADHSIRLLVESPLSAKETGEVIDRVQGSQEGTLGLCYDLGNAVARGRDPASEIEIAKEHIRHVHIKDCRFNTPGNRLLGEGDVDFPACFRALRGIGYTGLLSLETAMGGDPPEVARKHLAMVKDWMRT